jgi:hypothetical protein
MRKYVGIEFFQMFRMLRGEFKDIAAGNPEILQIYIWSFHHPASFNLRPADHQRSSQCCLFQCWCFVSPAPILFTSLLSISPSFEQKANASAKIDLAEWG